MLSLVVVELSLELLLGGEIRLAKLGLGLFDVTLMRGGSFGLV